MLRSSAFIAFIAVCWHLGVVLAENPADSSETNNMTPEAFQKTLIGHWQGTARTWFQPGKLADESPVTGTFEPVLGGRFVRHRYTGSIKGRPRTGEETIAFNSVMKTFQVAWVDDFHMSTAMMWSEGQPTDEGFDVTGSYDVGPGRKPWGWRTLYQLKDDDHLTITAYNVSPDGQESKAVETVYQRQPAD